MPVTSGVFARLWKFVDHRAAGDEVTRADLDTALDDFVPALNSALEVLASATSAAAAAAASASAAASSGATAGSTAGASAAAAAMAPGLATLAATLALMEDLLADAEGYVAQITPANFLALAQTTAYAGSCDAITTTGLVRLGSGASNGPAGTVQGDFLLTLVDDISNAIQVLVGDNGSARMALRRKVSGVWDAAWALVPTSLTLGALASKSLVAFSDVDPAAARLLAEGVASLTDAEFGTTAWVQGLLRAQNINSGTSVPSTSGTAIDITGIPSWAKRVTILFSEVSISATANFMIRLGTSGGIVSSGYNSGSWSGSPVTGATGMIVRSRDAATLHTGSITLENLTGNTWISSHTLTGLSSGDPFVGAGTVTLAAALDRVRITTTTGTDTFDSGTINITWE